MKTLVKKLGEVEIFVVEGGRFSAEFDGKKIIRTTLKAVEKEVLGGRPPLKAIFCSDSMFRAEARVVELVKVHGNGNFISTGKEQLWGYHVHQYDESALEELKAIEEEINTLQHRHRQIVTNIPRVTPEMVINR